MTPQAAESALQRVLTVLRDDGCEVTVDVVECAQALCHGREAVLTVAFPAEHVRHTASQRQQYSSWGWDTPAIDKQLRALDHEERGAILRIVQAALPQTVEAELAEDEADLTYGVAQQARVALRAAK